MIESCFEQNDDCHKDLKQAQSFEADNATWPMFIMAVLAGVGGGIILSHQLEH